MCELPLKTDRNSVPSYSPEHLELGSRLQYNPAVMSRFLGLCFFLLVATSLMALGSDSARAQIPAQVLKKSEGSKPRPLPNAKSLTAGWWRSLELNSPNAKERVAQWQAHLASIDSSPLSQTAQTELKGLREKVKEWQQYSPAPAIEKLPEAPRTLRAILELVERREQQRDLLQQTEAELERVDPMRFDSDQRCTEARNEYLDAPVLDPDARLALGWRWMRLRLSWEILKKRAKALHARHNKLGLQGGQLEYSTEVRLVDLEHGPAELQYWQEKSKKSTLRIVDDDVALDELSTVQELRGAILLRDQQLSSLIAQLALEICISEQNGESFNKVTKERPDLNALRDWLANTTKLVELRQVAITAQVSASSAPPTNDRQVATTSQQLGDLADLHSDIRHLRTRIEQYAAIDQGLREHREGLDYRIIEGFSSFADTVDSTLEYSLFSINYYPVTLLDCLRFLGIVALAYAASRGMRALICRLEIIRSMPASSVFLLRRLTHFIVMSLGLSLALSAIGIDLTRFTIFASALAVGLVLGLQSVAKNLVAGFFVLFERSLKIGDFIKLESGTRGTVRKINLRGTVITTPDNVDITISHSEFVGGRVISWSMRDEMCRFHIPFSAAYGTPKNKTKAAVIAAASSLPFTNMQAPRHPQVWLSQFGANGLRYTLIAWVEQDASTRPDAIIAAYNRAIESAQGETEVELPLPQRDINLGSYLGLRNESALSILHPQGETERMTKGEGQRQESYREKNEQP